MERIYSIFFIKEVKKLFNKEFYPTPKWMVDRMIDEIDTQKIKDILEPSAGKGDIIDGIIEKYEKKRYYSEKVKRLYEIFIKISRTKLPPSGNYQTALILITICSMDKDGG